MSEEKKEIGNPETCDGGPASCTPEEMEKCGCTTYFDLKKMDKKD